MQQHCIIVIISITLHITKILHFAYFYQSAIASAAANTLPSYLDLRKVELRSYRDPQLQVSE